MSIQGSYWVSPSTKIGVGGAVAATSGIALGVLAAKGVVVFSLTLGAASLGAWGLTALSVAGAATLAFGLWQRGCFPPAAVRPPATTNSDESEKWTQSSNPKLCVLELLDEKGSHVCWLERIVVQPRSMEWGPNANNMATARENPNQTVDSISLDLHLLKVVSGLHTELDVTTSTPNAPEVHHEVPLQPLSGDSATVQPCDTVPSQPVVVTWQDKWSLRQWVRAVLSLDNNSPMYHLWLQVSQLYLGQLQGTGPAPNDGRVPQVMGPLPPPVKQPPVMDSRQENWPLMTRAAAMYLQSCVWSRVFYVKPVVVQAEIVKGVSQLEIAPTRATTPLVQIVSGTFWPQIPNDGVLVVLPMPGLFQVEWYKQPHQGCIEQCLNWLKNIPTDKNTCSKNTRTLYLMATAPRCEQRAKLLQHSNSRNGEHYDKNVNQPTQPGASL